MIRRKPRRQRRDAVLAFVLKPSSIEQMSHAFRQLQSAAWADATSVRPSSTIAKRCDSGFTLAILPLKLGARHAPPHELRWRSLAREVTNVHHVDDGHAAANHAPR